MENSQLQNQAILNLAYCVPIESENAKCHPDLGDGRRSYKDNDFYVFEKNDQWYFVPERDKNGNFVRTIVWERFLLLQKLFGDDFKPVTELESDEEVL